jgi:Ketosteroid isomerase homolog
MYGSEGRMPRLRRWWIAPTLAVLMTAGVPLAAASGGGTATGSGVRAAAADDQLVTATKQAVDRYIRLWKENKLDELVAGHYTDDSILVPPNHQTIRGRAAILEYIKGVRDALGEFDPLEEPYQVSTSGEMLSLVGKYSFRSGQLRFTSHELYHRQPDGSVRAMVDMFGFAMP